MKLIQKNIDTLLDGHENIKKRIEHISQLFQEIDSIAYELLGTTFSFKKIIIDSNFEWSDCQQAIDFFFWHVLLKIMSDQGMTEDSKKKYMKRTQGKIPEFTQQQVLDLINNI